MKPSSNSKSQGEHDDIQVLAFDIFGTWWIGMAALKEKWQCFILTWMATPSR